MTTYYIDPENGSSANDGSSPALAKSRYSQLTVAAGDTVLFRRGTTHPGQISPTNGTDANTRTTLGAYGTGNKPRLEHSTNVIIKTSPTPAYLAISDLIIAPTASSSGVSGTRLDNPIYSSITNCDFIGGENGIRCDCVVSSSVFNNNVITGNTFRDQAGAAIRIILGTTSGADSIVGHSTSVVDNDFENVGKEAILFGTQGANVAGSRLHRYHTMTVTDNHARNCMLTKPATLDDDQCFSFKNFRETTLGNTIIARNTATNIGRTGGDSALIVGFWFEGMTKCIVADCVADNIMTPGANDGGCFFLDSNTASGNEFRCEENVFLRCVALNTNNNKRWVPYPSGGQGNNSDGFTISRGAINNVLASCIAINCAVGIHVTGNCQANSFYNCTTAGNDYGWYVQSNSGDTPAGQAQVIRNCISYANRFSDYEHSTAVTPKSDEKYNNFGVMVQDTADATTTQVDPKFVAGLRPTTAEGVKLRSDSPCRRKGASYLAVGGVYPDAGGRRARLPADLGAWQRRPGD